MQHLSDWVFKVLIACNIKCYFPVYQINAAGAFNKYQEPVINELVLSTLVGKLEAGLTRDSSLMYIILRFIFDVYQTS